MSDARCEERQCRSRATSQKAKGSSTRNSHSDCPATEVYEPQRLLQSMQSPENKSRWPVRSKGLSHRKIKKWRTRSKFRSPRSDVSCLPSIPAKSKPQPSDPRPSPAFQSTGPSLSATDSLRLKSDAHPTNARAAEIAFSILRRKPAFSPIAFPPLRSCAKAIPPQSPAHRIRGSPALAPRNLFACSHAAKFRSPAP